MALALVGLGLIILAVAAADFVDYFGGSGGSTAIVVIVAGLAVALIGIFWPLFMAVRNLDGVAHALEGGSAGESLRESARNWRSVSWVVAILLGIGTVVLSVTGAQTDDYYGYGSDFDGATFIIGLLIYGLLASLTVLLYFTLVKTMEGLAGLAPGLAAPPPPPLRASSGIPSTFGMQPPRSGWSPTHRIPEGGLPARARPDASLAPAIRIRTGTELAVIDQSGTWARVRTDQGWTAWVDGQRLVPVGIDPGFPPPDGPTPPPSEPE